VLDCVVRLGDVAGHALAAVEPAGRRASGISLSNCNSPGTGPREPRYDAAMGGIRDMKFPEPVLAVIALAAFVVLMSTLTALYFG
jgi:hypothetical protein